MKIGSVGGQDVRVGVGGAQATILVCVMTATGVVFVARLAAAPGDALTKPGQMLRIAIGGSVVLVTLLVTSMASPEFAKAMGWLLLLGTVIGYGSTLGITAAKVVSATLGHAPTVTPASQQVIPPAVAPRTALQLLNQTSGSANGVRDVTSLPSTVRTPQTAPRSAWEILTGR